MQDNSLLCFSLRQILEGTLSLQFFIVFPKLSYLYLNFVNFQTNKKGKSPTETCWTGPCHSQEYVVAEGDFQNLCFYFWALSLILIAHSSYAPPSLTCSALFKHKKNKLRKIYKGMDCCWQMVKITVSGEGIGRFKSSSIENPQHLAFNIAKKGWHFLFHFIVKASFKIRIHIIYIFTFALIFYRTTRIYTNIVYSCSINSMY